MSNATYRLVRSKRKTMALVIREDGSVEVRAPVNYPVESIERFIREKRSWVEKKSAEIRARPKAPVRTYTDGEYFPYMGSSYPLLYSPRAKEISLGQALVVPAKFRQRARRAIEKWYRAEALRIISARVDHFCSKYGFRHAGVTINAARRRWGSCNSRGALNFSYRLVMARIGLIDFVVLHELCHTVHQNHSPSFYKSFDKVLPDHAARGKELRGLTRSFSL
jgi:predicted metal-dependent hydrolase